MTTHVDVAVVDEHVECGQDVPNGLDWGRRILIPAQVDNHPRDIPEEGDRNLGVDEAQKGLHNTEINHVVTEVGAIAYDVT